MRMFFSPRRAVATAVVLSAAGGLLAGCGSSAGLSTVASGSANAGAATTNAAASMSGSSGSSGSGSMKGMQMTGVSAGGIHPIPTQVIGSTVWQHMNIKADAMTAVPFVIYNGKSEREIKPTKKTSFHLMVDLTDARTHWAIPYASVWATIKKQGKVIFDERQWPMISEYMGAHYGNNVTLPGAGRYTVSLLVSPPVSARHIEYKHVWLKPHRVNFTFNWKPGA